MRNQRGVSILLSFLLLSTVAATIWNGRHSAQQLQNFKIELTPFSLLSLHLANGPFSLAALAFVCLPTAILLVTGLFPARWLGWVIVLGLGAVNCGLLAPLFALNNALFADATAAPEAALTQSLLMPALLVCAWNLVAFAAFSLASLGMLRLSNRVEIR